MIKAIWGYRHNNVYVLLHKPRSVTVHNIPARQKFFLHHIIIH